MHFHTRAHTHAHMHRYVGKKARACAHFTHIQQQRKQTHKSIFRHTQASNVRSMTVLLLLYALDLLLLIVDNATHKILTHTLTLVHTHRHINVWKKCEIPSAILLMEFLQIPAILLFVCPPRLFLSILNTFIYTYATLYI